MDQKIDRVAHYKTFYNPVFVADNLCLVYLPILQVRVTADKSRHELCSLHHIFSSTKKE